MLIHSLILTRLDYCNGVLLGLPEFRLHQLQLVQNAAARLLADLPRYSHISDYMRRELHWLPVADRVKFKIATLVWKATTGSAPDYIAELCLPVGTQTGRRALRSASRNDLIVAYLHFEPPPVLVGTSRLRRHGSGILFRHLCVPLLLHVATWFSLES